MVARIDRFILASLILTSLCASLAAQEIGDSDVTAAVQRRLAADGEVHYGRIGVETKDGIVKLKGPVDNILAKERAVEIAKSNRGVRSVIDMIHLDAAKRDDEEMRTDVVQALEKDAAVEHLGISVSVVDGDVALTGTVDSFAERYLAERAAKSIKGVISVKNSIQIEHKSERPDDEIKADIEGRFIDSVLIDHAFIKVQVKDGNVELTGSVGGAHEKLRAEWSADAVAGVKSVAINNLAVNVSQGDKMRYSGYIVAESDEAVRNAIRDAFLYDPRIDPSQINIEVETPKGAVDVSRMQHVVLTGTVNSLAAKWAAAEDAKNTIGVSRVKNHLTVPAEVDVSDSELMDLVEKALLSDSRLESFRIRISILNGVVRLRGTVDSDSNRQHAGEIVSSVKGVVGVQNELEVDGQ